MQAPLRKGKREETLGRARGVTRTGRSLLFGLSLVGMITLSSLVYTWERLTVETMLNVNMGLKEQLELVKKRTEILQYDVARLEASTRIEEAACKGMGMKPLDWKDVIVIDLAKAVNR
jgi:predicted nucleic acid-binding protein